MLRKVIGVVIMVLCGIAMAVALVAETWRDRTAPNPDRWYLWLGFPALAGFFAGGFMYYWKGEKPKKKKRRKRKVVEEVDEGDE